VDELQDPVGPDEIDEVDPAVQLLYRVSPLRILGSDRLLTLTSFLAGEFVDVEGASIGSFAVSAARRDGRGDAAVAVTEIRDQDGFPVIRVVRRPLRPWRALGGRRLVGGQFVLTDAEDVLLGEFWFPALLTVTQLRASIGLGEYGSGQLHETNRRDARRTGSREFTLRAAGIAAPVARIVYPLRQGEAPDEADGELPGRTAFRGAQGIELQCHSDAPPAWRCTALALATCLPQVGVNVGVLVPGAGP
jgi:hypothetical protein